MGAGEAFAAGLLGVSDGEDDGIRGPGDFDGFPDELEIALTRGQLDGA